MSFQIGTHPGSRTRSGSSMKCSYVPDRIAPCDQTTRSTFNRKVEEIASSRASRTRNAFPSPRNCPHVSFGVIAGHHPVGVKSPQFPLEISSGKGGFTSEKWYRAITPDDSLGQQCGSLKFGNRSLTLFLAINYHTWYTGCFTSLRSIGPMAGIVGVLPFYKQEVAPAKNLSLSSETTVSLPIGIA